MPSMVATVPALAALLVAATSYDTRDRLNPEDVKQGDFLKVGLTAACSIFVLLCCLSSAMYDKWQLHAFSCCSRFGFQRLATPGPNGNRKYPFVSVA